MIHEDITLSGSFKASGSLILPRIPSNSLATPATGSLYYDTSTDLVKIYTGTGSNEGFVIVGTQGQPASGGGSSPEDIEYVLIAGGGGWGSNSNSGGGGAGGYKSSSLSNVESGSAFTITIGAGGTVSGNTNGGNGSASSIVGTGGINISTVGGGGGSKQGGTAGDGGSGGGGAYDTSGASGTSGQGFDGGSGVQGGDYPGGGGGGAAEAGNTDGNGAGGDGKASSITGTSVTRAGGGSGGVSTGASATSPGDGGGGVGARGNTAIAQPGDTNTGAGGGGGGADNYGKAGGSGVVIVAYPTASITAVGGTKRSTADGKFVHTFQSSGTLTVGGSTFHTIAPGNYFNTLLYTGDDSNDRDITGLGFQPDFVWIKRRNSSESHAIYDSVRGANKQLSSDQSIVEATNAGSYLGMSSFDSDGFNVGNNGGTNRAPNTYVAWSWKAGGNSNTFNIDGTGYASAAAAGLDDGSLTPTGASINTTSGFSIIKVTSGGSTADVTVSHGLGVKPSFVIFKKLNSEGGGWFTWHKDFPNETDYLYLNDSYKLSNLTQSANAWGNRSFDYEVVSFRQGWTVETNRDVIIYSFADIDNYQKAGSYDGTGNTNNQVNVGFRPRFLIIKSDSEAEPWFLLDSTRDTSNPIDNRLMADSNAAEDDGSVHTVDFTDTGFTANSTTGNGTNGNNVSYVYLAIA